MLYNEPPHALSEKLSQVRGEDFNYLSGKVSVTRGMASRTSQVCNLDRLLVVNKETFKDILADAEGPITPQRWV